MNARTQTEFNAVAANWTHKNPWRGVPHCTAGMVCNALHDLHQPSHNELAAIVSVLAGAIRKNGSLTQKCIDSLTDQLHEMADEIDQDLVNQQAEQAWNEQQARSA